jgi:hypothetical protein
MGNKLNKAKEEENEEDEAGEESGEEKSNHNDENIGDLDNDMEGNDNEEKEDKKEKGNEKDKKKNKKKKSKNKEPEVKLDKIEQLLFDTFQNTDIDFNYKEILTIKLRVHDAEKYFIREFNCLIYFNSYIFQQRLTTLYENYSHNAEKFLKKTIEQKINTNFLILIDFDDETEMPQEGYYAGNYELNDGGKLDDPENNNGKGENTNLTTYSSKIEYESLFTIIFEPLEIPTALFFLMTNHNQKTINYFFSQLYENIYLNKGNRKFDIMYFLLPNLDFFLRNEGYTIYIVNQSNQFDESLDMLNNYTIKYSNQYTESIYCSLYFKEMLNVNYNKNNKYGNSIINSFLKNIIEPSFVQSVYKFDTNIISQFEYFVIEYERDIEIINLLINISNVNIIIIRLDNFSQNAQKIDGIVQMVKKLLLMHDKAKFNKSVLIIRLLCLEKFEKNEKEKLSMKLNELILELINESFIFSSRERLRKNIIECFYYYKDEEIDGEKNNLIENDELNTSHENLNAKMGTNVAYKKEKIFCTYFLGQKQIYKMKKYIYNILKGKIKDKKSFANLFSILFDKKYYLMNFSTHQGTDNYYKVEKMFYI